MYQSLDFHFHLELFFLCYIKKAFVFPIFRVHADTVGGIDCGDEAAFWFQSYLKMEGVRLVRFFTSNTKRKYTRKDKFMNNLRKKYPVRHIVIKIYYVLSHQHKSITLCLTFREDFKILQLFMYFQKPLLILSIPSKVKKKLQFSILDQIY